MSIQITETELEELQTNFGGQPVKLNEALTTAGENEGITTHVLQSGRVAHFVYHYSTDSITVFKVEEPPEATAVQKLSEFLNTNPEVRQLLGI
jgi:hypothetical protein